MTNFSVPFGTSENELPVETGKYRLIRGAFCPFAHRPVIARELLGLDEHISMGTVDDVNTPESLTFANDPDGKDPVLDVTHMRDLYLQTDPDYDGAYSVPALVDIETGHVVRQESADILRDFSTVFKPLHREGAPDLYPEEKQEAIDKWNERIGSEINSGIYKIGFAKTQEDYEEAVTNFFNVLDELEEILTENRYIHGEHITESDIFLYPTLVRFDITYYSMFKANRNKLQDFPNLWEYARDLYQTKGFGSTTEPESIKRAFNLGTMGERLGSNGIIPVGPDMSTWEEPHTRALK
ncbi:glutathione S-transferase C-terminal domain-containing protein [Carnobacteriaceae bacterium 52-44]